MLGWLDSILNFFTGGLRDIWNKLISVVRTLAGWTQDNLSALAARYNILYLGEFNLSSFIASFINRTYNPRQAWIDAIFKQVINQERNDVNSVRGDLRGLEASVTGQFDSLSLGIALKFASLIKWIITTVAAPLISEIGRALGWIEQEGALLIDLITHPDKLLALLGKWLLEFWVTLFVKFSLPFARWLLGHWKPLLPTIVTVLEDIITHVL